jgi:hypothetical protein
MSVEGRIGECGGVGRDGVDSKEPGSRWGMGWVRGEKSDKRGRPDILWTHNIAIQR